MSRCLGRGDSHRSFVRRFRTRAERIADLEAYLRDLEAEAAGVREALTGLRSDQV